MRQRKPVMGSRVGWSVHTGLHAAECLQLQPICGLSSNVLGHGRSACTRACVYHDLPCCHAGLYSTAWSAVVLCRSTMSGGRAGALCWATAPGRLACGLPVVLKPPAGWLVRSISAGLAAAVRGLDTSGVVPYCS